MKISDVTLTLFAWGGIPPTTYGRHTGRLSGSSELGLLTIRTDAGVGGHALPGLRSAQGPARRPDAAHRVEAHRSRPGSARPRAPLAGDVAAQPRHHRPHHWRNGRGALGHG